MGAFLLGAVIVSGCGGDAEEGGYPGARSFASWDEFLASGTHRDTKRDQVVFIGIDAGVWHFIDRLIDAGKLPNLARIKREGAYGPLISVPTYVTPPAWVSLFTGYKPRHSGVYSFGYWDSERREFMSANSDDIRVPSVWEAASRAGLKVGIFNVPMTYPPRPVNGAMVSGQMTPIEIENPSSVSTAPEKGARYQRLFRRASGVKDASPPEGGLLEDSLNFYLILAHDTVDDGRREYDTIAMTVIAKGPDGEPDAGLDFRVFDAGKYSPWLKFKYRRNGEVTTAFRRFKIALGTDDFDVEVSQNALPIDVTFTYPEGLADELNERFGYYLPTKFFSKEVIPVLTEDMVEYSSFLYDYDDWDLYCFVFTQTDNIQHIVGYSDLAGSIYQIIDRFVGEMMERLPAGATLIVGSDHGSREFTYGIDMNQLLARMNLLEFKSDARIDHDRTIVFHNQWHLYFNNDLLTRDELVRRGFDLPESTEPREWLIERLRRMTTPALDETRTFVVRAEPLPVDAAGRHPDMVLDAEYEDYMEMFWNIMNPGRVIVRQLQGSERFWHSRDGVVMMWGDRVRAAHPAGPRDIQDVAPTILYLLGLPVADDMDGRIMFDSLVPDVVKEKPVLVNRGYRDIPREAILPGEERETLRKKLRSLGYIQ